MKWSNDSKQSTWVGRDSFCVRTEEGENIKLLSGVLQYRREENIIEVIGFYRLSQFGSILEKKDLL